MNNSIIVSSLLLGSAYIFSKTLQTINKLYIIHKIPNNLIIINGLTLIISGYIFIFNVKYTVNAINNI